MDCGPARSVSTSYLGKNHHLVGLEAPVTLAKSLNFTDSQREEILEEKKETGNLLSETKGQCGWFPIPTPHWCVSHSQTYL